MARRNCNGYRIVIWAVMRRMTRTPPALAGAGITAATLLVLAGAACSGAAADADGPAATGPAHAPAAPSLSPRPRPRPARVIIRHLALPDGNSVTVARFTGPVRFVLHCGSADPGGACHGLRAGPAVAPGSRRHLLAAFNGGFLLSTGVGGYEQAGRIISPLQRGRASLVIYRSGAVGLGAWGRGVPEPGQAVFSVRQNLNLMVRNGHPTALATGYWQYWGATLGGGQLVARSALGLNARGQLIYAGSMSANPADMATALIRAGARTGMELDINPEWVQLAYARHPGWRLYPGVSGQARPANQYLIGWTRDFIAVMARG
jgi:hypothetical protein